MANDQPRHELARMAEKALSDDGELDGVELDFLISIALSDRVFSDEEKRALSALFRRIEPSRVEPLVWTRIRRIEKKLGLA